MNNNSNFLDRLWQWTGFQEKTLWDWLNLLIVPIAISGGALYLNRQWETERVSQEQQWERERVSEEFRQQTLASILDKIETQVDRAELKPTFTENGKFMLIGTMNQVDRELLSARVLMALEQLDGSRKKSLMRFLNELHFLPVNSSESEAPRPIKLYNANLRDADLSGMKNLSHAMLSGAFFNKATLINTDFSGASLSFADFSGANLSKADFSGADLDRIIWDQQTNWSNVKGLESAKNVPENLKQQLNL